MKKELLALENWYESLYFQHIRIPSIEDILEQWKNGALTPKKWLAFKKELFQDFKEIKNIKQELGEL